MKVHRDNGKKRARRFFRKESGSIKNGKNVPKIKVFRTLLKIGSQDFVQEKSFLDFLDRIWIIQ